MRAIYKVIFADTGKELQEKIDAATLEGYEFQAIATRIAGSIYVIMVKRI